MKLSLEQKLGILQQILNALDHAHKQGVIHRNITPDSILLTTDGQALLTGFDYARINNHGSTIAHAIVDNLEPGSAYQAIECYRDPSKASITSDLFSVGLVFYELLTGRQAFESAEQIVDRSAIFPVKPSTLNSNLSPRLDDWLQKLCTFEPKDRFQSADDALKELTPLASLQTLDLTNLPTDSYIDNRYRIISRLGKPGSFGVAYRVFDTRREGELVLKLVLKDRYSVSERQRQEYKILEHLPAHEHVAKTKWADDLKDGTPFIAFEYIDGLDIEQMLEAKALSLEESIKIAQQTAKGLLHLHHHSVYHRDIKPSNLLLTDQGVRIIDFNVAVSAQDECISNAGTRRYIPPDFKFVAEPSAMEQVDRDLYGLGITLYQCITGHYPFREDIPPIGILPRNPREFENHQDLSDELVQMMVKAIAPKRAERFKSAEEFLTALNSLSALRAVKDLSKSADQNIITELLVEPKVQPQVLLEKSSDKIPSETKPNKIPAQILVSSDPDEPQSNQTDVLHKELAGLTIPSAVNQQFVSSQFNSSGSHLEIPVPFPPTTDLAQAVVLDPTEVYPIPSEVISITTEVQWMQEFLTTNGVYYVKGQKLCNWAEAWLRARGKVDVVIDVKQHPRVHLETLLYPFVLPTEWTEQQLVALSIKLSAYPKENPIAHCLADLVEGSQNIWFGSPSINHLAQWLSVHIPCEWSFLERTWQNQIKESAQELTVFYDASDKVQVLKRWLGLGNTSTFEGITEVLGPFPISIPDFLVEEVSAFFRKRLLDTEGDLPDEQFSTYPDSMREIIAEEIFSLLKQQQAWITANKIRKISRYLEPQQRKELEALQPPLCPTSLDVNASVEAAMQWATKQYLPFRYWETSIAQVPITQRASDQFAETFVAWLLEHYPKLKLDPVRNSSLNYSVASLVQEFCKAEPVLWVVIDGLGWLDHEELLRYLTRQNKLKVERALEPRLSILPTKTEYAKWSLYTQLPPNDSFWEENAKTRGFSVMLEGETFTGERYTDNNRHRLIEDLKSKKHRLYCWDTLRLDEVYHHERNWKNLYQVQRPQALEWIAKDILYFLEEYPDSEQFRVVIASDHGQLMGESEQLKNLPPEWELKGRSAKCRIDDPRFVILEAQKFSLPYDISVVKNSATFNPLSLTVNNEAIGSHGGLFPEEVIVGVSVLCRSVIREPVIVRCHGDGKAGQPGELEISIKNPNTVPLTSIYLQINELPELGSRYFLDAQVSANEKSFSKKIPISCWPELPPDYTNKQMTLTGELTFQFAGTEAGFSQLEPESAITITQLFSVRFDIDDLL